MDLNLVLEENRSKNSVNKDFYQTLNFERSSMSIPVSDINSVVNTYDIFENERNISTKYRLNVTLNPIMSNVLSNKLTEIKDITSGVILTGNDRLSAIQTINDSKYEYKLGYDIFDNNFMRINTFKTGTTLNSFTGKQLYDIVSIEKSVSDNITEDNGWLCVTNKTKINGVKMFPNKKACEKIDLFPTRHYLLFKPSYIDDDLKDNWSYTLTYPYENYTDHILVNSNNGINGIPVIDSTIVDYNGNKYLSITTAYKHGLNYNDIIKIKLTNVIENKTYFVYDVGNIDRNNKEFTFLLDADKYYDLINYTNNTDIRIVRVINKIDSEYYIRKFRKLPNFIDETIPITDDNIDSMITGASTSFLYEAYQPGFSRNIFNDSVYQVQYIDDIDINLLKDNLGRPLTEIYFTIIKKNIIDDNNEPSNMFTKVMSGIDSLTGSTGYANIRIINSIDNLEPPLEDMISITGSTISGIKHIDCFLGDIVEYNKSTVRETKLADVEHRFNTIQREKSNSFMYNDIYGDGSNLFKHSTIDDGVSNWFGHNSTITTGGTQNVDGNLVNSVKVTNGSVSYCGCISNQAIVYEKGKTYYVSFYAKANGFGLSLDWVGVNNLPELGNYSFSLTTTWQRFSMPFVGDGKKHGLIFQSKEANSNIFYITKIKVEENVILSDWTINPIENNYVFINKTLPMEPFKEGYMYKPNYKIQLKEYSDIINNGEFPELNSCDNFISGMTIDNEIVLLDGQQNDNIKSLALRLESIDGLSNFDKIRITNNGNNKYVNLKITLPSNYKNTILIPYSSFFGDISTLNTENYTIRKYSDSLIPMYCQDSYNGKCLWRNILQDDEHNLSSEKDEYIFTNGRFYTKNIFNFYLKRQDPFGYYNLRSDVFPADSFGNLDETQIINNIIQKSNDIC